MLLDLMHLNNPFFDKIRRHAVNKDQKRSKEALTLFMALSQTWGFLKSQINNINILLVDKIHSFIDFKGLRFR